MIVATAGHIDHGKTALVNALTGIDTDRLAEEQRRGMTIDLGFAYATLADRSVLGFVDVPGHERFIRNMLAGVTGIDYALLVVAADDGPMPQTEEHLAILDLLGVNQGIAVVSKADRVANERLPQVQADVRALLTPTTLAQAPIIAVSAHTGSGIDGLRARLEKAAHEHQSQHQQGVFRLAIDRCFTLTGIGLVATGTVFSGQVHVNDRLLLSPQGITVRVRGIHAQNQFSSTGIAGQRLGLNIVGADLRKTEVRRGQWLLAAAAHAPTARLDCRIRLLASETHPLKSGSPVHLHLSAVQVLGRAMVLADTMIKPGTSALVQLVLKQEIGALHGDRVILRDNSAQRTIGGGKVIDPFPPQRGRGKPERLAAIAAMDQEDPASAFAALLQQLPGGIDVNRFQCAWNLPAQTMAAILRAVPAVSIGTTASPWVLSTQAWEQLHDTVVAALDDAHKFWPNKPGLTEQELRRRAPKDISIGRFRTVLSRLLSSGTILRKSYFYQRPNHVPTLTKADNILWEKTLALYNKRDLIAPRVLEIADELALDPVVVGGFLFRAQRLGLIVQVAKNRFFLPETLFQLAKIAAQLASDETSNGLTAATFRDRSGLGRNLTIELLEFFDDAGFTRRSGPSRQILRPATELFEPDLSE